VTKTSVTQLWISDGVHLYFCSL